MGTRTRRTPARVAGAMAAGAMVSLAFLSGAHAQALSELSCKALWSQPNAVDAEQGSCFKIKDTIATFGARCYPPSGELTPDQQHFVNEVQGWQARKGCR